MKERLLAALALAALVAGGAVRLGGSPRLADWVWGAAAVAVLVPLALPFSRP